MSSPDPIRVLLVDDHVIVREGLKMVLGRDARIRIVGEAGTAQQAVSEACRANPDVVLMDIRLPDGDGVQACSEILEQCPQTRVLFLTSYADDDTVLAAILAGAHGYFIKEIGVETLVESIKRVAAGESILDQAATQRVLAWVKTHGGASPDASREALSPQEQRIVALVAAGKTNKEIATELGLSPKTVKNYLSNIYQKLQITRRAQAAALFAKQSATRANRP
ncbi:MAG: response regulator transcription factor [Nitrospirota bacterium]